jgi:hypothetical protein
VPGQVIVRYKGKTGFLQGLKSTFRRSKAADKVPQLLALDEAEALGEALDRLRADPSEF